MKTIDSIKLSPTSTIREALQVINIGALKIAMVVDHTNHLLGTLSDGDIRRGLLNGLTLDNKIESIIYRNPTVCSIKETKEEILKIAVTKKLYSIPIIDENGVLIGVEEINELLNPVKHNNKVILMVGGLGTRLRPLTEDTPKPMLHVGGKPILQTIVEKFVNYGFVNIIMCVGYKSRIIQDFFGDGSAFGAHIEYVLEEKRMGTAGALSLIDPQPDEPFFVMNGDLLTNINLDYLRTYHLEHNAMATMCVREYDFQVPYGVVNVEDNNILSIEEKPVQKFFVSAGIYMLDPKCITFIPENKFYDMPTLFETLIRKHERTVSFPLREYWLDIGRIKEYEKANLEYHEVF